MLEQSSNTLRSIDQPHYSYWQAFYRAFYSNLVYLDAAKRWKGFAFPYLFFLVTLLSISFAPPFIRIASEYSYSQYIVPLLHLPPLSLDRGELLFQKAMPYKVLNNQHEVVAIVDTTGAFTVSEAQNYPELMLVLGKRQWHVRLALPPSILPAGKNRFENRWISDVYPPHLSGDFFGATWLKSHGTNSSSWLVIGGFYLMLWVFIATALAIVLLFFSSLGQLVSRIVIKQTISFKLSFRLILLAATPALTLLGVLAGLQLFRTGMELFLVAILAFYYTAALISFKHASRTVVRV